MTIKNLVVYTALYGDYLPLQPIPAMRDGYDDPVECVCFSDRPQTAPGWTVMVEKRPEAHPRLQAKYFKLNPHECLSDYRTSVWIDASCQVLDPSFAREVANDLVKIGRPEQAPGYPAIRLMPHRWRTTVADELLAHTHPKYTGLPLREQVEAYRAAGFPDDIGLFEGTLVVRDHMAIPAIELGRAWWAENLRWSYADQLSLPFVLWRLRLPFGVFPWTLDRQRWLKLANWRAD